MRGPGHEAGSPGQQMSTAEISPISLGQQFRKYLPLVSLTHKYYKMFNFERDFISCFVIISKSKHFEFAHYFLDFGTRCFVIVSKVVSVCDLSGAPRKRFLAIKSPML